jgi:hypothetical protein
MFFHHFIECLFFFNAVKHPSWSAASEGIHQLRTVASIWIRFSGSLGHGRGGCDIQRISAI